MNSKFSTCSSCSPSFCSLSFIFSYFRQRICSLWLKTDRCQDGVVFTRVSKAIHIYSFGFALLHYMIGLKTLRHFAMQSEVLKPIVTRLHMFPALHVSNLYLLQVLIGSLDCLSPRVSMIVWGLGDDWCFGFGFMAPNWKIKMVPYLIFIIFIFHFSW